MGRCGTVIAGLLQNGSKWVSVEGRRAVNCARVAVSGLLVIFLGQSMAAGASAPIAKTAPATATSAPITKSNASAPPVKPAVTPPSTAPGTASSGVAAAHTILEPGVRQSPPPVTKAPPKKPGVEHRSHVAKVAPKTHQPHHTLHHKPQHRKSTHHHHTAKKTVPPHPHAHAHHVNANSELAQVRGVVQTILATNADYMKSHPASYFKKFADQQTPRATVLTCADSREQTTMMELDPDNDLFVVRDIGNQLATVQGSIEYGIKRLHTPLLMIIGHSACGAVTAAASDYSSLEPAIRKELETINIPKGIDPTDGALLNVNNQVEGAILNFSGEIESGKLAIIGAFYDFRNDLQQGYGKLVITNINGETDPDKIQQWVKNGQFFKTSFVE